MRACPATAPCLPVTPAAAAEPPAQPPHPPLCFSAERAPRKDARNPQGRKGRLTEKAKCAPPAAKLALSELASPEDWPAEEEIRRFWRLRQEIVEKERAGALAHQLLPVHLPASLRAALDAKGTEHSSPRHGFR